MSIVDQVEPTSISGSDNLELLSIFIWTFPSVTWSTFSDLQNLVSSLFQKADKSEVFFLKRSWFAIDFKGINLFVLVGNKKAFEFDET